MFNGIFRLIATAVLFLLIVGLSACQPSTVVPALVVPAVTETQSPAPTITPTQPSPTPIPTANFAPEDIIGVWARSDPDRGDLFITISSDGSYSASHGTPDDIVHSGAYTLDGRLFTFVDGWNCSPEATTPGQYVIRLTAGKYLLFEPYKDTCPDRPSVFKSLRWDKFEATPAP